MTGTYSGEVRLWDLEAKEPIGLPVRVGGPPEQFAFSGDNRALAVVANTIPQLTVWDTAWLAESVTSTELFRRASAAGR